MRLSYNWLKEFVDLKDISVSNLAEKMTFAGFEVEGLDYLAKASKLVIGEVIECKEHPDSDHLHCTKVNVGNQVLEIVCGAPNVRTGLKVIVALDGCELEGGTIKSGVIRGQKSEGMLCSLAELNVDKKTLTDKQINGIEELNPNAPVGCTEVLEYLGLDDVILDVSLTPNRNDCLSMWAMANEIGAILKRPVKIPNCDKASNIGGKTDLRVNSKTSKCSSFLGKKINHVTIKESPDWLKKALTGAGVKVINNVVDISNYVMLETGQPLHFYDLKKIPHHEITVVDGLNETYTALDGIEYQIKPEDIMITTNNETIGIAGIMGGDDSKIEENTTGIIIEAAIFDLAQIRMSSRRLNLMTEAATHFSKGIEPLAPVKAMDRAVQLLIDLADADGIEETAVFGDFNYKPVEIDVTCSYLNNFLSTNFTIEQIVGVFESLHLNPTIEGENIHVIIPSYRQDLRLKEDLAEEVVRLLGYDSVPSTFPKIYDHAGKLAVNEKERYHLADILSAKGFSEVKTYSLVSKEYIDNTIMNIGEAVVLQNPLSEERKYFRTSLLSSMLEVIAYNKAHNLDEWKYFEVANVSARNLIQKEHLMLAMSEKSNISKWKHEDKKNDFFTMKALVLDLLHSLGYEERRIGFEILSDAVLLHPFQSAYITLDKKKIGYLGSLHPETLKKQGITQTLVCELDLSEIHASKASKVKFNPIPKYPSVKYDIALIVDDSVSADKLVSLIKKQGGKLVTSVEVFDVYYGLPLLKGTKSIAITITYQSLEKTLTDQDINPIHTDILMTLKKQYNAVLREA